jgi:hypothetical protein
MKIAIVIAALAFGTAATAQQAGTTYPDGSNLPQRTAGEVGQTSAGQIGGSVGPTSAKVQSKAASKKGAKPSKRKSRRQTSR